TGSARRTTDPEPATPRCHGAARADGQLPSADLETAGTPYGQQGPPGKSAGERSDRRPADPAVIKVVGDGVATLWAGPREGNHAPENPIDGALTSRPLLGFQLRRCRSVGMLGPPDDEPTLFGGTGKYSGYAVPRPCVGDRLGVRHTKKDVLFALLAMAHISVF